MKKVLLALFMIMVFPSSTFAQLQTDSNTVRTRVGNPPENNDLVKASLDLKSAYDTCNNGYTFTTSGLQSCLGGELEKLGYGIGARVDAFLSTLPSTLVSLSDGGVPCSQCLGFVRLAATLAHGGGQGLAVPTAADVSAMSSFTVGGTTYTRVPGSAPLEPGDVGARPGGAGHIIIVAEVLGNIKIRAIESNGYYTCQVTDSRLINTDGYNFFRAQ